MNHQVHTFFECVLSTDVWLFVLAAATYSCHFVFKRSWYHEAGTVLLSAVVWMHQMWRMEPIALAWGFRHHCLLVVLKFLIGRLLILLWTMSMTVAVLMAKLLFWPIICQTMIPTSKLLAALSLLILHICSPVHPVALSKCPKNIIEYETDCEHPLHPLSLLFFFVSPAPALQCPRKAELKERGATHKLQTPCLKTRRKQPATEGNSDEVTLATLAQTEAETCQKWSQADNTKSNYKGYMARAIRFLDEMVAAWWKWQSDTGICEDNINTDLLSQAFWNPPNKYSVTALLNFMTQKCFVEKWGKLTGQGIQAAMAKMWDDMCVFLSFGLLHPVTNISKRRKKVCRWKLSPRWATDIVTGNLARAPNVRDYVNASIQRVVQKGQQQPTIMRMLCI